MCEIHKMCHLAFFFLWKLRNFRMFFMALGVGEREREKTNKLDLDRAGQISQSHLSRIKKRRELSNLKYSILRHLNLTFHDFLNFFLFLHFSLSQTITWRRSSRLANLFSKPSNRLTHMKLQISNVVRFDSIFPSFSTPSPEILSLWDDKNVLGRRVDEGVSRQRDIINMSCVVHLLPGLLAFEQDAVLCVHLNKSYSVVGSMLCSAKKKKAAHNPA